MKRFQAHVAAEPKEACCAPAAASMPTAARAERRLPLLRDAP